MNRQSILWSLAVTAFCISWCLPGIVVGEEERPGKCTGAAITYDRPLPVGIKKFPQKWQGDTYWRCRVPSVRFHLGESSRLTAVVSVTAAMMTQDRWRIHAAVFDGRGQLLGTANEEMLVEECWLGTVTSEYKEVRLNLGASRSYEQPLFFVVGVVDVPD